MPMTIATAGTDKTYGRSPRRHLGTVGGALSPVILRSSWSGGRLLGSVVVIGVVSFESRRLAVDLGFQALRQRIEPGLRVLPGVDVLQRHRPVLGRLEELLLRRELDLGAVDHLLEGLQVAGEGAQAGPERAGLEHRRANRV